MPNMSYCRFENTKMDFEDCVHTVEDMCNGDESKLSESELHYAKRLTNQALRLLELIVDVSGEGIDQLLVNPELVAQAWDKLNASCE